MDRYRNRQRQPYCGIVQRREKRGQPLRQIVGGDRESSEQADAGHKLAVYGLRRVYIARVLHHVRQLAARQILGCGAHVRLAHPGMRVRNEAIDGEQQADADEEEKGRGCIGRLRLQRLGEGDLRFGENLDKRHINHRAARKGEAER